MRRREFLRRSAIAVLGAYLSGTDLGLARDGKEVRLKLFLAGDLMVGRGMDQILPYSVEPVLHEPFVKDARDYVRLAERANGQLDLPVPYGYPWGDALAVLEESAPHARIVNLETSVTTSDDWARDKQIHYRMHPANIDLLTVAGLDVCTLGNNHVLDWGRRGLLETLDVVRDAGIATPGAGRDRAEASEPAVLDTTAGRLLIFSFGTPGAGVPPDWQATEEEPGVNLLPGLGTERVDQVIEQIERYRTPGDLVILSMHWGGNWGYQVPAEQREFAHRVIDAGAVDLLHGHSSHHPKAIEVYRDRPILYGAGDLLNDYEGIGGREEFRGDIVLLYFLEFAAPGTLGSFEMVPMQVRRLRLERATAEEAAWIAARMNREARRFGGEVELTERGRLALHWHGA